MLRNEKFIFQGNVLLRYIHFPFYPCYFYFDICIYNRTSLAAIYEVITYKSLRTAMNKDAPV